ncbi:MAG: LysR family transcriptional regulator [Burkholderiaceae bacterium]
MPLNLPDLLLLDTISRHGSFAAAARELGKVPSALTYSVRKFEEELDVLLFDRRGQRAVLTPAGKSLLHDGRQLIAQADAIVHRTRQIGAGWEISLTIGADALVSFQALAPLLSDFDELGAPTQLRLSYEVLHGTWDALTSGRADLVIGAPGARPPTQPAGFDTPPGIFSTVQSAPMGEVNFVFCVPQKHPLIGQFAGAALSADLLRQHRAVVVADSGRRPGRNSQDFNPTFGVVPGQDCISVGTLEQKILAQKAGLGVGFIPEPFARPHLASGELVALPVAIQREPLRVYYAWAAQPSGRALAWWLNKLQTPRMQQRLLSGPAE